MELSTGDDFVNKWTNTDNSVIKNRNNRSNEIENTIKKVEWSISQLELRNANLGENYLEWQKASLAFASLGEQGREYFHRFSRVSQKYNERECDHKFDNALKTGKGTVTIATFFDWCKNEGITLLKYEERFNNSLPSQKQDPPQVAASRVELDLGFEMTFSYEKKHNQPSVVYNCNTILYRGEIGVLVALPGAGKTSTTEIKGAVFIASKNNIKIESGGIQILTGEKKALFIDTERPNDDNHLSFERMARRLNVEENFSLVQDHKFKDLDYRIFTEIASLDDRKTALEHLLSTGEYEFVLLDGVLDFSAGLNDERASLEAVTWLRSLASKYDCTIWVTLHPNKGTENMAGHLGAFLYRFCRACLIIRPHSFDKSIKEITVDFPQGKLSHSDPSRFEPLYFTWDDELKMMMPTEKPSEVLRPDFDIDVLKKIFNFYLLKGIIKIPSADLKREYGERLGLKESASKMHIRWAVAKGFLRPEGNGKNTKYVFKDG